MGIFIPSGCEPGGSLTTNGLVPNARISCHSARGCSISCSSGEKFSNGASKVKAQCSGGRWTYPELSSQTQCMGKNIQQPSANNNPFGTRPISTGQNPFGNRPFITDQNPFGNRPSINGQNPFGQVSWQGTWTDISLQISSNLNLNIYHIS